MPFHIGGLERLRTQLGILVEQARGFVADRPFQVGTAVLGLGGLITAGVAGLRRIRRRKKSGTRKKRRTKKTGRGRKKKKGRRKSISRVHIHRVKHRHRVKHKSHASPRHRGHKRVSFTTKSGQKVSFLTKK